MISLLISEYRKFVSTRMWWVLLIIMAVYMGLTALGIAYVFTVGGEMSGPSGEVSPMAASAAPSVVYTTAASLGYVFPALIGVTSMAGEFRHKTITPTLLATPQRGRVLVGKLIAAIPMGILYGVVGTAACVLLGAIVLNNGGVDPQLGSADTWEIIARSVLSTTIWLLVGVALGSVLTNQVAAIVLLLVFTQFIEPVARMLLPLADWGTHVAKYLPGAAGDSIAGGSFFNLMGGSDTLGLGAAVLVLLAYAVFFALLGRVTTLRRDIG